MPIAIIAAAALSAGSPTYLSCSIEQDGEQKVFQVAANEQEGRAMVTFSNGRTVEHKAAFSPTEVRIGNSDAGWVISRVDLGIQQTMVIGSRTFTDDGSCKVTPAPAERAF